MSTVVHVGPHPDDEVLGAGGALAALTRNGHRVVNLACSLGRPVDRDRRRAELHRAADVIGFETVVLEPPAHISSGDDHTSAAAAVARVLTALLDETSATVVVSPHPHDGHHGHEAVARGVRDVVRSRPGLTWWMWGLWQDLPIPTLYVPYDQDVMDVVQSSLSEYGGENARNGYDVMHTGRATTFRCLGSERVLGFGAQAAHSAPYADLITEVRFSGKAWQLAAPRVLDPDFPFLCSWDSADVSWLLDDESVLERWRRQVTRRLA